MNIKGTCVFVQCNSFFCSKRPSDKRNSKSNSNKCCFLLTLKSAFDFRIFLSWQKLCTFNQANDNSSMNKEQTEEIRKKLGINIVIRNGKCFRFLWLSHKDGQENKARRSVVAWMLGFLNARILKNLVVNNIVRSKYIFVENNKVEILFSNNIFGLTF